MTGRTVFCLVSLVLALPLFGPVAHAGAGDIDSADEARSSEIASLEKNPYTGDAAAIEEGKSLWRKTGCYACHGGVAEGGVGPSLIDDEWVFRPTDKTLYKAISKGRRGTTMKAWSKKLTPDEIWKVIAYIRSLYQGDPNKIIW